MVCTRTLNRLLLLALPFAALLAACGRGAGADPHSTNETAEEENTQLASAPTNLEQDEVPVEIVDDGSPDRVADGPEQLNEDGSPIAESGRVASAGPEGDAPDFVPSGEEAGAQPAAAPTEDGIAQSSDALTSSTRRLWVRDEAKRQVDWLRTSTSYYSHETYMNESTGTRRTDCSGYVAYAFSRVLPVSYNRVNDAMYGTSVKSDDWFDYLSARPTTASTDLSTSRWRRIPTIESLKPGDLLVWKNPSTMENTGHTMIVRDYPRAGRSSKSEILVPVYDSTSVPHSYGGAWDSRGTSRSGVGAGTIGIKVNSSGQGVAYYWTGGTSGDVTYRTIIGGRIE